MLNLIFREEVKFLKPKKNKRTVQKKGVTLVLPSLNGSSAAKPSHDEHPPNVSVLKPPSWVDKPAGHSFADILAKQKVPDEKAAAVKPEDKSEILAPPEDEKAVGSFRAPLPEKTTFLLLHLSLLRDYIDEEFTPLKKSLENHPSIKYVS